MTRGKPVTVALMGAGARGELNLAMLMKRHPGRMKIVAVAERDDQRREQFARSFDIPRHMAFADWAQMCEQPRLADAVVNALPCRLHYESTLGALHAGYHLFLEKPMALSPVQCAHLTLVAKRHERILMIALQSRYNKIYTRVRKLFDQGTIGCLMTIDSAENIGYWHFILSYVRGIHHKASMSHSFVMAKGVHDLDLISWYAGAPARRVASFGGLDFFHEGNAPEGAPQRCMDGCPVETTCEFSAIKQFLVPGKPDIPFSLFKGMSWEAAWDYLREPRFRTLASVIVRDIGMESRVRALQETMNGRCVFRCDNDVVDHQTVSIEFENGVTASFSLNAFSLIWERTLNLHGTKGEIRSDDFSGRLQVRTFRPGRVIRERIPYHGIIHGGGDETILVRFAQAVQNRSDAGLLTGPASSLESHFICFAAEQSRLSGKVVEMEPLRTQALAEAAALEA